MIDKIEKDSVINTAQVLANLLADRYDDLTVRQLRELEKALEAAFKIVERRR